MEDAAIFVGLEAARLGQTGRSDEAREGRAPLSPRSQERDHGHPRRSGRQRAREDGARRSAARFEDALFHVEETDSSREETDSSREEWDSS